MSIIAFITSARTIRLRCWLSVRGTSHRTVQDSSAPMCIEVYVSYIGVVSVVILCYCIIVSIYHNKRHNYTPLYTIYCIYTL
jgi:hypothetical protein